MTFVTSNILIDRHQIIRKTRQSLKSSQELGFTQLIQIEVNSCTPKTKKLSTSRIQYEDRVLRFSRIRNLRFRAYIKEEEARNFSTIFKKSSTFSQVPQAII